jgi:hypothetical protein
VQAKADTFSFSVGRSRVRTSTTLDVEADSDQRLRYGRADHLDVNINALAIDSPKGRSHGAWIDLTRGHVQWSPDVIDARFAGRLDDLRPILAHSGDREYLIARMPDLDLTKPLSFSVDLHRGPGGLDIHVGRLHRTGLKIEAFRHSEGGKARTAIRLERADIGITRDESSKRNTEVLADEDWFRRKVRWAKAM